MKHTEQLSPYQKTNFFRGRRKAIAFVVGGVILGTGLAAAAEAAHQRLSPQTLKIRDASSYFIDGRENILQKFTDSEKRHCEMVCAPVRAHQGLVLATGPLASGENTTNFGIATATPEIALTMTENNNYFAGITEFPKPGMPNQILTIINDGPTDPNGNPMKSTNGEDYTAYFVYRLTGSTTQEPQYSMTVCSSQDEVNAARNSALGKYGSLTEIPLQLSWNGDSSEKVIPVYKEVVVLSQS